MSFNVTIAPSGRVFHSTTEETVLAAAIRAGVGLPYGCKDGACGTCKCKKLQGSVRHGAHQSKALSAEEEASGWILTCCAIAQSDVTLESPHVTDESAFPIKKMPVRIKSLERVCPDVMLVQLQLPPGQRFNYHAGQYIDIALQDGERRSYSMANAMQPEGPTPGLELHVRHLPGGKFTDALFNTLQAKDMLRIEGPYGSFFLREDSPKPIVLLASGTGLAPIKALIESMQLKGITRPTVLYWGVRRPLDLYLHDWVCTQVQRMPHLRYVPVVSEPQAQDAWTGRTGLVHQAVLQDLPDLSGHQVYACGAPSMVEHARSDYTRLAGLPEDEFFADAFVTKADTAAA